MKHPLLTFFIVSSTLTTSAIAAASLPQAGVVSPRKVEWLPNKAAATEVRIHGAFSFRQKDGSYSTPKCGVTHYVCPSGSESLCRMQWGEVEMTIGQAYCRAYGQEIASTDTLYSEGMVGKADTWDLGMGTSMVYGIGDCSTLHSLDCSAVTPDAGPADSSPVDSATVPTDTGTTTDSAAPAEDSAPAVDSGSGSVEKPKPVEKNGGGCSLSAANVAPSFAGGVALLAIAGLARRRRRG